VPLGGRVEVPVAINVGAVASLGSSRIEIVAVSGSERSSVTMPLTVTTNTARVHVVYLVPSDRTVNATAVLGMERAIRNLQIFYQSQLGTGKTFAIAYPVVQVIKTAHPTTYYQTNPSGQGFALDFWANATSDGFALTGGGFYSQSDVWLYYIDADPLPGQVVGGTSGVAVLPAGDVRGLSGQSTEPLCRWVGGLGHELGHAFGLPHPPACDPVQTAECPINALMWFGYITYPNAFLTASDKTVLNQSPFFSTNVAVTSTLPDCTQLLSPSGVLAQSGSVFDRAALTRSGNTTPLACGYEQLRALVAGSR
jgi:hypothetical protein